MSFRAPPLDGRDKNSINLILEKYVDVRSMVYVSIALIIFLITLVCILFIPSPVTDTTFDREFDDPIIHVRSRWNPEIIETKECPNGYHKMVPLGSDKQTCVVNIPVPKSVDETIMNKKNDVCKNTPGYMCGNTQTFNGIEDISFGNAGRSADKMFSSVARMSTNQLMVRTDIPHSSAHNFVLSCVYSSIRPNYTDDLLFAHESFERIESSGTDDYQIGFSIGTSIGMGDEAAISVNVAVNPVKNTNTVVMWKKGLLLKMLPFITSNDMKILTETACKVMVATGHFPFDEWLDTTACSEDLSSLYYSLASAMARLNMPDFNYDYYQNHVQDDLRTMLELSTAVGSSNFVTGVIEGMESVFQRDKEVLNSHGIGVPDLKALEQLVPNAEIVRLVIEKARSAGVAKWKAYIRAMMVVNDYQYSDALMTEGETLVSTSRHVNPDFSSSSRRTAGIHHLNLAQIYGLESKIHIHGHNLLRTNKPKEPEKQDEFARDEWEDESALVNSVLYDECAFLAAQYLPEIEQNYAKVAVSDDKMKSAVDVTNKVRNSIVSTLGSEEALSTGTRKLLKDRMEKIVIHEGNKWIGVEVPILPYDINPTDSFLRNAKKVRMRNQAQFVNEMVSCHGRPASECVSNAHTVGLSGREINAFFNPTTASLTLLPGIMHPIFFSDERSPISQLARAGSIIGHEFYHSIDNSGSAFDNDGNIGKNWQPDDLKNWLREKEECFMKQLEQYRTPLGNRANASRVLGEVMADVWGANAALRAVSDFFDRDLSANEVREFIEAYSQTWCADIDAKEERDRASFDEHPPPSARIDIVVRNLVLPSGEHALTKAYGCVRVVEEVCAI